MAGLSTKDGFSFRISVYCARCERPIGLKERGAKTQRQLKTADLKVSITELKVLHDGRCVCGSDTFHIRRGWRSKGSWSVPQDSNGIERHS